MATTQRNYKIKDVDMLVTASTIVESASANVTFLQTKRANWDSGFFRALKSRIQTATQTFLGVDSAQQLRQSTITLTSIQTQAIKDLAEVKIQISEDFKSDKIRRAEVLTQLGFNLYHKDAQKGDQEALINLLYQFKTNLTAALKSEIVSKGTAAIMLDNITAYSDTLMGANVTQENFKGTRKTITAAAVKEFNEIYESVISIAKIAGKFYKDQPDMKDQFSFAKVSKALNTYPTNPIPVIPTP